MATVKMSDAAVRMFVESAADVVAGVVKELAAEKKGSKLLKEISAMIREIKIPEGQSLRIRIRPR
jgi:hypothetical protein